MFLRVSYFIPRTPLGWIIALVAGSAIGLAVVRLSLGTGSQDVIIGLGAGVAGGTYVARWVEQGLRWRARRRAGLRIIDEIKAATEAVVARTLRTGDEAPLDQQAVETGGTYGPCRALVAEFIDWVGAMTAEDWEGSFAAAVARSEGTVDAMARASLEAARAGGAPDRLDSSRAAIRDIARRIGRPTIDGYRRLLEGHGVAWSEGRHGPQAIEQALTRAASTAVALVVSDRLAATAVTLLAGDLARTGFPTGSEAPG